MLSYSTIPADEAQQPVKGASWKRVVVVAATASFVLGTVVLRSATPLTTALHSGGGESGGESGGEVETVTVDTDTDPCGHQMDAFFKCTKPFPILWDGDVFSTMRAKPLLGVSNYSRRRRACWATLVSNEPFARFCVVSTPTPSPRADAKPSSAAKRPARARGAVVARGNTKQKAKTTPQ